jgi:hypothetical protein
MLPAHEGPKIGPVHTNGSPDARSEHLQQLTTPAATGI